MPIYKQIVVQSEPLPHNGVTYHHGDTIMKRVVMESYEADILNSDKTITGCEYVLIEKENKSSVKINPEKEEKKAIRESLKARAEVVGLKFRKTVSNEELEKLVIEAEK